jgi:hypothetical protein
MSKSLIVLQRNYKHTEGDTSIEMSPLGHLDLSLQTLKPLLSPLVMGAAWTYAARSRTKENEACIMKVVKKNGW